MNENFRNGFEKYAGINSVLKSGLVGAGVGAGVGAISAKKGNRLHNAAKFGLMGGLGGLVGAGVGAKTGNSLNKVTRSRHEIPEATLVAMNKGLASHSKALDKKIKEALLS